MPSSPLGSDSSFGDVDSMSVCMKADMAGRFMSTRSDPLMGSLPADRPNALPLRRACLATACTHKIAIGDSNLVNVRFGPLCGLKSDISRGPRSAKSGCEQSQQICRFFDHLVSARKD